MYTKYSLLPSLQPKACTIFVAMSMSHNVCVFRYIWCNIRNKQFSLLMMSTNVYVVAVIVGVVFKLLLLYIADNCVIVCCKLKKGFHENLKRAWKG